MPKLDAARRCVPDAASPMLRRQCCGAECDLFLTPLLFLFSLFPWYCAATIEQVERARAVFERALRTIAATEEAEKLNIWGAAMGLEQRFGSAASLEALVKRAVSVCEPKRAHERLLAVLAGATSTARAEAAGSASAGGGAKRQGVRAEAAAAAQEAALHKVMCKNYKVRERLRCRCCCFEMCG